MSKVLKIFNHTLKRKGWTMDEDSRKPLVNNMTSHFTELVTGDSRAQTCCLIGTDQSRSDLNPNNKGFEDEGQRVLSILRDVLLGDPGCHERKQAAEQVKQWAKLNGITPEGIAYSENWLREYQKTVEMSVEKHFPNLPLEGSTEYQLQTGEYLKLAMSLVCSEVIGLVPILEDSGLLSFLVDSYNRRLFAQLHLLMDRSSSVKEALFLLQWVKQTYFSHSLKGSFSIQDDVLRVSDPLMLTDWFEKSRQRLLTLFQNHISDMLQNVLQYNEAQCDDSSEENLIRVHLDVIQCLNAAIQGTKTISQTLMTEVQRLCCDELNSFVQRYLNAEKKHLEAQKSNEAYSLHFFRIIDTCKHLRSYVLNIVDSNNNTDSSTLLMLENMEAQVSFSMKQWLAGVAEVHLKKYFKEKDEHINNLMDMIKEMLGPLPQKEKGNCTKQHIVNAAYECVTRAYLKCLMQRKCKQLEKRWGRIDKRMMQDAEHFHYIFAQLVENANQSISDEKQKFLLKMGEILGCSDVNSLKLLCAASNKDFPRESEEYLAALLKWKKELSKRQIKEILDVSQEICQNGGHMPHGLKYWSCCLCCT